ncbi:MAG: AAA family ATPase [Silanimonas sp.]
MLIALAGLPGAGKSTLARGLQAALHAEVVSRDAVRMSEFPNWDDRAAKRAAFEIVRLEASVLLKAGATVVVDGATLSTHAERRVLCELAESFGRRFVLLWLDVPVELAAARIAGDRHEAPRDRRPALASEVAQRFEAPLPGEGSVKLDASAGHADVLKQGLAAIAARSG